MKLSHLHSETCTAFPDACGVLHASATSQCVLLYKVVLVTDARFSFRFCRVARLCFVLCVFVSCCMSCVEVTLPCIQVTLDVKTKCRPSYVVCSVVCVQVKVVRVSLRYYRRTDDDGSDELLCSRRAETCSSVAAASAVGIAINRRETHHGGILCTSWTREDLGNM